MSIHVHIETKLVSRIKTIILPTCLEGNYRNSLGELSNTSYGMCGISRVKKTIVDQILCFKVT